MEVGLQCGIVGVFILGVIFLTWRRRPGAATQLPVWLDPEKAPKFDRASPFYRRAFYAGLSLTTAGLLLLEYLDPLFFSQDDNLSSFFPVILHGCRSLFSGVLPTWNAYQYLGAPTISIGLYSLTYPLTIVAYALARFIFGNENAAIEILAWLHMVGAYIACFLLARRAGVGPWLCLCAAFCTTFSGYQLMIGRSWYYMLPVTVWFPLLLHQWLMLLERRPLPRAWVWQTGLLIGIWFHAGNAQMWCYGLCFLGLLLAIWWLVGDVGTDRLLSCAAAAVIGAGLAMPLALLQLMETKYRERAPRSWVRALPLPMLFPFLPIHSFKNLNWSGMYYSGAIFSWAALAALASAVGLALRKGWTKRYVAGQVFTWCALLALLLGLGEKAYLWDLLSRLPVFYYFSVPFKFQAFIVIFTTLSGALLLERLFRGRWRRPLNALGAFAIVSTVWNAVASSNNALYYFNAKPYPAMPKEFTELFRPGVEPAGRVFAHSADRSGRANFVLNLPLNFATVYEVPAFGGYDTTIDASPIFKRAQERIKKDVTSMAEYGVKWIVSDGNLKNEFPALNPKRLLEWNEIVVYEVPSARPLVFDANGEPVPFKLRGDGFDLFPGEVDYVTANFLRREWMSVYDDKGNRPPLEADHYGRVTLRVNGAKTLSVRYEPPWRYTIAIGLLAIAFGLVLERVGPRLIPRAH